MRYLLLLLTFSIANAQVTLTQCADDALYYGNQSGPEKIFPVACFPLLVSQKNNRNSDLSSDNYVDSVGFKNMLHTKHYGLDSNNNVVLISEHVITGKLSRLYDIQAIDFNEFDGRIYVLNKTADGHQQVFSYPYDVGGNYTSLRRLEGNSDVDQASNIRLDPNNIYLISNSNNWVKAFNRVADPDGPKSRPKHKTDTLRTIAGNTTTINSPVDIALSSTEIFILEGSRVLVFNKSDNGDVAPKRVLDGPLTTISGAKKIEIEGNEIHITNGNGSTLKFATTASGNQSPL